MSEAERVVPAVLHVLKAQSAPGEGDDIATQLPREIEEIRRAARHPGRRAPCASSGSVRLSHSERRDQVERFEWAQNNFGVETPHQLQSQGVNVFFAPNISPDTKVVNLEDGRVQLFVPEEHRPQEGYYADYESLARYCRERGIPLVETNGQMSTEPMETQEAGDPLLHGEEGSA